MINLTAEHQKALTLMLDPVEPLVFITGRAGTGKSTLLKHFKEVCPFKVAFLAPTGVAALNIGGMTLHSFFGFPANVTLEQAQKIRPRQRELYKQLEVLVIDEISMVRCDLIDAMDVFLRRFGAFPDQPFGGVRMIWFGDLFQLPPVLTPQDQVWFNFQYKSPYFFHAHVFAMNDMPLKTLELTQVFRQSEIDFIQFLNKVRANQLTYHDLEWLHAGVKNKTQFKNALYLTTTNKKVELINTQKLQQLPGEELIIEGRLMGEVEAKELPTEKQLSLRIGARVMVLINDSESGRFVNGSLGVIRGWKRHPMSFEYEVEVLLDDSNQSQTFIPYSWEYYQYDWDPQQKKVLVKKRGSYIQMPLKLAWALTIHKSQGLTFDQVHLDLDRGTFSHGQAYVALSRCRTLKGLSLARPLRLSDIKLDQWVPDFLRSGLKQASL
jgi:ATP-dependent DNA helicase PIF1